MTPVKAWDSRRSSEPRGARGPKASGWSDFVHDPGTHMARSMCRPSHGIMVFSCFLVLLVAEIKHTALESLGPLGTLHLEEKTETCIMQLL